MTPHPPGVLCAKCGYSLAGLEPGRCPECGGTKWKLPKPLSARDKRLLLLPLMFGILATAFVLLVCLGTRSAIIQMLLLIYVPPVAGLVNGVVMLRVGLPVFLHLFPDRSGEQIGRVAAVAAATLGAVLVVIAITVAAIVGTVRFGMELNHIGYC